MGILYQTESFLTAWISLVHEPDKPWSRQYPPCTNSRKELRRNCSPIGHNNTKLFLCPIRSRHLLEFLEIVRWESVPRGSFARTWKLSSGLFSLPDWLPLSLRGWLFTSVAEDLNSGRPTTNPASGHSGIRTRDRRIASTTRWPLGHDACY